MDSSSGSVVTGGGSARSLVAVVKNCIVNSSGGGKKKNCTHRDSDGGYDEHISSLTFLCDDNDDHLVRQQQRCVGGGCAAPGRDNEQDNDNASDDDPLDPDIPGDDLGASSSSESTDDDANNDGIAMGDGEKMFFRSDIFKGRDQELLFLERIFLRLLYGGADEDDDDASGTTSIKSRAETVLVSGYSGSGKSTLVRKFRDHLSETHEIFYVSGKFQQESLVGSGYGGGRGGGSGEGGAGGADPFSAVVDAFANFFQMLVEGEPRTMETVRDDIREALGKDGQRLLTSMIPGLYDLLHMKHADAAPSEIITMSPAVKASPLGGITPALALGSMSAGGLALDATNPLLHPESAPASLVISSAVVADATTVSDTTAAAAAAASSTAVSNKGSDLRRFTYIFTKFIKALSSEYRPLVVFLDDLQVRLCGTSSM